MSEKATIIAQAIHDCRSIIDQTLVDNGVSGVDDLDSLVHRHVVMMERISDWGTIPFMSARESIVRAAFQDAVGVQSVRFTKQRAFCSLGKWSLSDDITCSCYIAEPLIATSSWSLRNVAVEDVNTYVSELVTLSPSMNGSDGVAIQRSIVDVKARGRYASSLVGLMESRGYPPPCSTMIQLHLKSYAIVYAVRYVDKLCMCVPSYDTLILIRKSLPEGTYAEMDDSSLTIYAVTDVGWLSRRTDTKLRTPTEVGKHGNVKITFNGTLRYLGAPDYVHAAHRRLYQALMKISEHKESLAEFLQSLHVAHMF